MASSLDQFDLDQFDLPLGGLTAMPHIRLERTHMEAAIAEVRFLPSMVEISEPAAVAVWDGIGRDAFPVFERHAMSTVDLTVSPEGTDANSQIQQGWALASATRRNSIMLLPAMVAVQTTAYSRYSTSIGDLLNRTLSLFTGATGASLVQRLGLRYINRLQDHQAVSPQFWKDHLSPAFGGPLTGDLAELIDATHQQVVLKLNDTASVRINSGVFREEGADPRYSYLVDIDVFREQAFSFDADLCSNRMRQMNRTAFALFGQVLSGDYLEQLGLVRLDGKGHA